MNGGAKVQAGLGCTGHLQEGGVEGGSQRIVGVAKNLRDIWLKKWRNTVPGFYLFYMFIKTFFPPVKLILMETNLI